MSARSYPLGLTTRRLRAITAVFFGVVLAAGIGTAVASWITNDSSNEAVAAADTLPGGNTPSASVTGNSSTVTVTFPRASSTGGHALSAYNIKRYTSAGTGATAKTASCSGTTTITCTITNESDGSWKYTDTPTIAGSSWVGSESPLSATATTVDTTAPTVTSVNRAGASSVVRTGPLSWTLTFSEPVSGVTTSNVALVTANLGGTAPSISSVTPTGSAPATTWTVLTSETGTTGTNSGTIGLNWTSNSGVSDASTNALSGSTPVVGQSYTFDTAAPTVTSFVKTGTSPTNTGPLNFSLTFSEPVTGVTASNFSVMKSGVQGSPAIGTPATSDGGTTWTIAVATTGTTGGDGATITLNMANLTNIKDAATNGATGSLPANQSYGYDTTAPTINTFSKTGTSPTKAGPLNFSLVFSESVTGVTASNLSLTSSAGIGGTAPVLGTPSTSDGITWTIAVTTAGTTGADNATITLAVANLTNIKDGATNNAGGSLPSSQVYVYDTTAPTVASFLKTGTSPAKAGPLNFSVTFSEPVTGVTASNFSLTTSGTSGTAPSIGTPATSNGTTWTVAVSTSGTVGANNATVTLAMANLTNIKDVATNSATGSLPGSQQYVYDTTAPTVSSFVKTGTSPTNTGPLNFSVTFSEPVTGVAGSNFTLTKSGTGGNQPVLGSPTSSDGGTTWTIAVTTSGTTGTDSGTITLAMSSSTGITDLATNSLSGSLPASQAYGYDTNAPTTSSITLATTSPTNASSVSWTATFSEPVSGVTSSNFTLATTGLAGSPTITGVTGTAPTSTWTVTASTGTGNGTIGVNKTSNTSITDAAGNALTGGNITGSTYTIDKTAPAISSVALNNKSGNTAGKVEQGDSVVVTFSERMAVANLCSAWSGDSTDQSLTTNGDVVVTLTDGGGSNDSITVTSGACTLNFGTLNLGSTAYTTATRTFSGNGSSKSSVAWDATGFKLTITLGSASSTVGIGTVASSTPILTVPAAVTDSAGNGVSNSPFTLPAGQKF